MPWYHEDDPVLSNLFRGDDKWYTSFRDKALAIRKKYGIDMRTIFDEVDDEVEDDETSLLESFDPARPYTNGEMEEIANEILRADAKRELCRHCDEYGEETGHVESVPQFEQDGITPVTDDNGDMLYMDFPELQCPHGHRWYRGEGKARGIKGDNPILFENHLADRKRREIYVTSGVPDPHIESGLYNRTHPEGRKVNSKEQRKKNGASFFR